MDESTLLLLVGLVLLAMMVSRHVSLARTIERPTAGPPRRLRYPSLSVVRPIRGLDVGARGNLEAALAADYPGELETIFVLDDASDPSRPLVEEAVRAHRERGGQAQLIFAGPPPAGRTGKLNAMIAGASRARGELIAFGDSDTRPAPDLLRLLVDELLDDEHAGSTFAPVLVADPPRTPGDVGYALLVNGWYGPEAARLQRKQGALPFIMGQLMVFRREALAAAGGLACADGQLVDDMYIGGCVARAGFENRLISAPLAVTTGGMSLAGLARLLRRWLLFSRNGLPATFTSRSWMRGATLAASAVTCGAAISIDHPWAALPSAAAFLVGIASPVALNRRFGGAPIPIRYLWVALALPLAGPLVILSTILYPKVDWRGRDYPLDLRARLRAPVAGLPNHLDATD